MVAVIKTGHSLHRILNYNENKVTEGVAELISAANYPMEADEFSFHNKLNMLVRQAALNENVTRNSVHISLNFDPSEAPSKELLAEIADLYMEKIGFGEQPYLVYQHFDAGHPHIHIVSVKVRADGSRIDTQNIGRNQSETARKELEEAYGLKKAEGSRLSEVYELKPVNVQKALYGKSGTKRAITNVLDAVLGNYKYTSLNELNAVLKLYNVLADRGSEDSKIYQHHGLTYRILDSEGNKVGVPIKASDFYSKPTLSNLEAKFPGNEQKRQPHKGSLKNVIDMAFVRHPGSGVKELVASLEKEGISVVLRQNDDSIIYGITYVDHRTKCVFNGSALGKKYSAKGILERCGIKAKAAPLRRYFSQPPYSQDNRIYTSFKGSGNTSRGDITNIFEILAEPERTFDYVPAGLRKGKRKRKKRNRL
jgi:hypothetical protein